MKEQELKETAQASLLAETLIRDILDFPKPGILFKDITPVFSDFNAMKEVLEHFHAFARRVQPDVVVGIESRGFVFAMSVSQEYGVGFVPVRKPGKLPYNTIREEYSLEYGTNVLEMHVDAIRPGMRALIIDDLLATGGTAAASARLVERLGGVVCGMSFMVELEFLKGRAALPNYEIQSLISY
jgi:adenine phosphoribosyltransferase